MSELQFSLQNIQSELNAPKGQRNNFGNYNYRSCEDILTALKPLLKTENCTLIINDEIVLVGDRFYVKATATLHQGDKTVSASALAREPQTKKGMDDAQITGSTSSYARKYALNGLFAIDDTKDADTQDNSSCGQSTLGASSSSDDDKPWYGDKDFEGHKAAMIDKIATGKSTPNEITANLAKSFKINKKIRAAIQQLGEK